VQFASGHWIVDEVTMAEENAELPKADFRDLHADLSRVHVPAACMPLQRQIDFLVAAHDESLFAFCQGV
jgi:hypothetical protein